MEPSDATYFLRTCGGLGDGGTHRSGAQHEVAHFGDRSRLARLGRGVRDRGPVLLHRPAAIGERMGVGVWVWDSVWVWDFGMGVGMVGMIG
jgi:hypothetical protein